MGIHIQKKRFDHIRLAEGARDGFHDPAFRIPGVTVTARVVEEDGGIWLYVTSEGPLVKGDEVILPDYEVVT